MWKAKGVVVPTNVSTDIFPCEKGWNLVQITICLHGSFPFFSQGICLKKGGFKEIFMENSASFGGTSRGPSEQGEHGLLERMPLEFKKCASL